MDGLTKSGLIISLAIFSPSKSSSSCSAATSPSSLIPAPGGGLEGGLGTTQAFSSSNPSSSLLFVLLSFGFSIVTRNGRKPDDRFRNCPNAVWRLLGSIHCVVVALRFLMEDTCLCCIGCRCNDKAVTNVTEDAIVSAAIAIAELSLVIMSQTLDYQ